MDLGHRSFCGLNAHKCDRNSVFKVMSLRVARGVYNPEKDRIHFYVAFKPALDPTAEERGVQASYPIDVALSVTETVELADLAFTLPNPCCNNSSLLFLQKTDSASV